MFKTIVVPVALSEVEKADRMLNAARQLGGEHAHIVLMSVIEDIPTYVATELPGGYMDRAKKNAHDALSKIARESGLEVEIVVRSGQPSAGILGTAKEKNADAIIIASHQPGLSDYLLGSTAHRVVRHAKCAVLVLR
ncbi:universal stress protein [Dichotomicrobium thermohalophilum]|uniref:Nucleotide-binding universal stress UspA family protein n=1 Tax=Dichotomicrobium thermohalophilum TaxID=933063 RepID=A0A397Q2I5_9HYPH|nr:universal stress protein [Dichotomicrobium thermohalophilum]RIA55268.1 nucleotide-binding universal stress UspA family protein [Dichotomicrobium thermohalophilum]